MLGRRFGAVWSRLIVAHCGFQQKHIDRIREPQTKKKNWLIIIIIVKFCQPFSGRDGLRWEGFRGGLVEKIARQCV